MTCNPCTTCGSNVPCGCSRSSVGSSCVTGCGCGNSGCGGSCNSNQCCSPSLPATPLPFYQCAPVCKQDNTQKIFIQQFRADVKIEGSWNIPDCGNESIVFSSGLKGIVVGSYLWNPDYGYYEVTAFDISRGLLTLLNHCNTGNAAAGTNVPACTEFTNTAPPCDCSDDSQVCVAIDFTAPDVDDCIDITLTATTGLTAGDTVQIGTGFYFLEAIKPNNIVTICNQGDGITPGTPVIAKDANDNYQYCLSVISTNPCSRTPDYYAPVLACNNDGVPAPLDGSDYGWVVSMVEPTENLAQYRPIGNPSHCNSLSAALNIVNGTANYTNIAVESSAQFSEGEEIIFSGYSGIDSGLRLTITNIPDGTHIDGTIHPTPTADVTIPDDTLICTVGCCEYITDYWVQSLAESDNELDTGPVAIDAGNLDYEGTHLNFSIVNPSTDRDFLVSLNFQSLLFGTAATDTSGDWYTVRLELHIILNGGSPVVHGYTFSGPLPATLDAIGQDAILDRNRVDTVAPGATNTYEIWSRAVWVPQPGQVDAGYSIANMDVSYNYIGHLA